MPTLGFKWVPAGGGALPARAVPMKKEEDVDTDDELCNQPAGGGHYQHVLKKEEDVDTDDGVQSTGGASEVNNAAEKTAAQDTGAKGEGRRKTFEERVDELSAYKAEHGHLKVNWGEDKRLYNFCDGIRQARRGKGGRKLTEERIASLDALGFEWEPQASKTKFHEKVQELKAYKAVHGHINVKRSEDKSLYKFCVDIRGARTRTKLTEGRIASLDAIGFEWAPQNRKEEQFQERLEELKAYKAEHWHVNVKKSNDKSLHQFCKNIRDARRGRGTMKLTEERIASLDAIGFDWGLQSRKAKNSFHERIEQLTEFRAKHGHVNVKKSQDKSLAQFCANIRKVRRNPESKAIKLTEQRIAALDALGFDWGPRKVRSFQERVEELKAYKAKHGHLNVKKSEDKSLAQFCAAIKYARKHPERSKTKLTEERIASLDTLGFDWNPNENGESDELPENEIMESEEQSTESTLLCRHPLPSDSDVIDVVEV